MDLRSWMSQNGVSQADLHRISGVDRSRIAEALGPQNKGFSKTNALLIHKATKGKVSLESLLVMGTEEAKPVRKRAS